MQTSTPRELRRLNERRCADLLARSALLDTTDFDFDRAGAVRLDDDVIHCLVYMRDVEGFTNRDLVGLSAHPTTLADPLIAGFLDCWRAEEQEHSNALDRFLVAYHEGRGRPVPVVQPAPPAVASRQERIIVGLSRPVGHVVTAAHMAWGATNELLTLTGYRLLAERCGHPMLARLLSRIADQEVRHYSFYLLQTQWRLAQSRLVRFTLPRLLEKTWTPVGVGGDYKTHLEFDRVLATLAAGDHGRRAIARMDQTLARLPAFGQLRLYADAVTTSFHRLSTGPADPGYALAATGS